MPESYSPGLTEADLDCFLPSQAIVCIQGQEYLVRNPDVEMVEVKAGDMDDERDPCREPRPPASVIPPEDGQEESQELQNLPGATDLSREQVSEWKQVEESQVGVAA